MARQRINRGLVALSVSAIAAVYMTGYVHTSTADAALNVPLPGSACVADSAVAQAMPDVTAWRDGTYTGTGSSRRGDVSVSVDVRGGRIANVQITRSTMQYPLRDMAQLAVQVVQRQSPMVDIVSRATYSSMTFR